MNTHPHSHDLAILDRILSRGLCSGAGDGVTTFCAEQAVAVLCGLPVTDQPDECVTPAVSTYGRRLNDSRWASDQARAAGMRDFLLAQIGSKGVVDGPEFARRMALETIRRVLPHWLRHGGLDAAALAACENAPDLATALTAARSARDAARKKHAAAAAAYAAAANAAYAADANAAYAADAAAYASAAYAAAAAAADAAAAAADAAAYAAVRSVTLPLSAQIAVEILRELHSPGCELIGGAA